MGANQSSNQSAGQEDSELESFEWKEEVLKNEEVRSLFELYFQSITNTLDLLNTMEKCIRKAEVSELSIRLAIKWFEIESMDTGVGGNNFFFFGGKKKKYAKTLEELSKFKAMGNPFGDEFRTKYESGIKPQLLLEKVYELKVKLSKKHKNIKRCRIVSNGVLATTTVLSAMGDPTFTSVHGLAAFWKWSNQKQLDYENAAGAQKDMVEATEKSASIYIVRETTQSWFDIQRIKFGSMLEKVEYATESDAEEFFINQVMRQIMKNVEDLTRRIQEVSKLVAEHSKFIVEERDKVLHYAKAKGKN